MFMMSFVLVGGDPPGPTEDKPKTKKPTKWENTCAILIFFTSIPVIAGFTLAFGWKGFAIIAVATAAIVIGCRKFLGSRFT
jgi:hypothetical protein